jgi:sugar O-acyltransferase (sialic acid O-acetyltransferase NeuD family)
MNHKKNIVVIGAGLHGLYCLDILEKTADYHIIGLIDSLSGLGSSKHGYQVIGRQERLPQLIQQFDIFGGVIALGDNYERWKVHYQLQALAPNFNFINAIHPTAVIGKDVSLGKGVVVGPGAIINPGCKLGDMVHLANGVSLGTQNEFASYTSISSRSNTGGLVKVGTGSAITMGVTIIDRLNIGSNTVVGAGSLVLSDLDDNIVAYGRPAKKVKDRKAEDRFLK